MTVFVTVFLDLTLQNKVASLSVVQFATCACSNVLHARIEICIMKTRTRRQWHEHQILTMNLARYWLHYCHVMQCYLSIINEAKSLLGHCAESHKFHVVLEPYLTLYHSPIHMHWLSHQLQQFISLVISVLCRSCVIVSFQDCLCHQGCFAVFWSPHQCLSWYSLHMFQPV